MNTQEFKQVTQDEWADFLIQHECHGVEFNSDTLDHVRSVDGLHLATVIYKLEKEYWIRIEVPKLILQHGL
jgi:hypothetical protein